jgi:hypothetical protein
VVKNRFGYAFQARLAEIVYQRPWPIRVDRLVPVPITVPPTSPPPAASRSK